MNLPNLENNLAMPQTQLAIENLSKIIMEKANSAIGGAAKTIIPNIPKLVDKLTEDLKNGPIFNFSKTIVKLEKLVETLGLDLGEYSKDLANMLSKREETARQSEEKVQKLRENGIIARVNKETKLVEVLTKSQIRQEEKLIKETEKRIIILQKELQLDAKRLQTKDDLSNQEKKDTRTRIETNSEKLDKLIIKTREGKLVLEKSNIPTTANTGGSERGGLPMFLENMKDGFLTPFRAVAQSFMMLKEGAKGTFELFNFLSGGLLLKAFKILTVGIKALGAFFTVARLLLVLKFMAVIGAIAFVADKIDKIKDFFVKIIDWFRNSYLGKLLGLDKESTDKAEEKDRKKGNTGKYQSLSDTENYGYDVTPDQSEMPAAEVKPTKALFTQNEAYKILPNNSNKITSPSIFENNKTQNEMVGEFGKLQTQSNKLANSATIQVNNAPTTVSTSNSGSVVSGFVHNSPDETIINTSSSRWNNQ